MALDAAPGTETIDLLMPGVKCAGCIAGVERALRDQPGVRSARVNLTNKRLRAEIDPGAISTEALVELLNRKGTT